MSVIATSTTENLQGHAQNAARKVRPVVAKLMLIGLATRGSLYVLVGILALKAAVGWSRSASGQRGAMYWFIDEPFGRVVLLAAATGLAAFGLAQLYRAVHPRRSKNDDAKWGRRIAALFSAVFQFGLAFAAARPVIGWEISGDEDTAARGWSATFMSYPLGWAAVACTGIGIVIFGIVQIYKGYRCDLGRDLMLDRMSSTARSATRAISRFGLFARGVAFGLVGSFLFLAAWHERPAEARGLGGALNSLQQHRYGPWFLGIVALGLMSYGFYLLIRARFRRLEVL